MLVFHAFVEVCLLFSSPEPLAQGELLRSLDVCHASSTISLKGHLLLNYFLDFDRTWEECS